MEARLFRKFTDLAYQHAGIALSDEKEALVSARVAKRIRALGLETEQQYIRHLEEESSGEELILFLDAISTNFTSFFREADHFQYLDELLRQWLAEGRRRLRLWCAAAATGEEPYSIAMVLREALGDSPADARLLATDISTHALSKAVAGVYESERLKPLTKQQSQTYFAYERQDERGTTWYRVSPALRELLVFKRLNLNQPPFPLNGPLDVVFCRNVMIYFDRRVRQRLIAEIERLLKPGGVLFIGHTETLSGLKHRFELVRPSVLRKPKGATA
ncbi:MAG: methyltransferase domain-containing protein [Myxococcales bacterium]|nr:methyltransferase domain-containing protein [Myxococcales bacterium]